MELRSKSNSSELVRLLGKQGTGQASVGDQAGHGHMYWKTEQHLKLKSSKRRIRRKNRAAALNRNPNTRNDSKKAKILRLKLGTWNVRTMTPGITDDLRTIEDARKTAVIDIELNRLKFDIVALQETRLADSGFIKEKNFTFYWKGNESHEKREHGVGFAVRNTLLRMIEPPHGGTERLLTLCLSTTNGKVNLVSAYAPTNCSPEEAKDAFYEELSALIQTIPKEEKLILMGDFNARVGSDSTAWPNCIGKFGIGNMNENGQRLLELCTLFNMCITNTYFQINPKHRVSWRHPRSKLWHQLDLVITKKFQLHDVLCTRSFHSADCDTDHSLVGCKAHLKPKKIHRSKPPGKPRIDITKTKNPELEKAFSDKLEETLPNIPEGNAQQKWNFLEKAIYSSAMDVFGKKNNKNQDWFNANSDKMSPLIKRKQKALLKHKQNPSPESATALRQARSDTRKMAKKCSNEYWQNLCHNIQLAADTGNIKGVYEGIKTVLGPTPKKTAPLKNTKGEIIKDKTQQLDRWVEHYCDIYSRETKVTSNALDQIDQQPCMLELDATPTREELHEAIDALPTGKSPGLDGIPAEAIKAAKGTLSDYLLDLLHQCWIEGQVPQEMRDSNIITLYKNKGDRSDCNNYRGISLLSIVGKCFARIVLKRLQILAEEVYPESQCGFRPGRSTIDMIFSIRQLQERCREQRQPLFIAFIDLTKAFDLVSRDGLFKILCKIGCPPTLLSIIKSFHDNMYGTIQFDGENSKPFNIRSGVKQGCVLAPTLFGIFFSIMLKHAFKAATEGIYMYTRSDGSLFNITRLKAKTRVHQILVRDLLFADDAAVVAHSEQDLQGQMDKISTACKEFGLTISIKKTEVMVQGTESTPEIKLNDHVLNVVESFTYLGSTISNDLSYNKELNRRIGLACTTFGKLTKRVWENRKLTNRTKASVYSACVLSTLLYGSETWTLYTSQEKRLNTFHMKCLRKINGISWKDFVTNSEVLEKANLDSIPTILKQKRLRWLGHVARMEDGRLPKDMLFGDLSTGSRPRGRPCLCYRHICKQDLRSVGLDANTWQKSAADRTKWRQKIRDGLKDHESTLRHTAAEKRSKRKASNSGTETKNTNCPDLHTTNFHCTNCGRDCHSRIGLYSHSRKCV